MAFVLLSYLPKMAVEGPVRTYILRTDEALPSRGHIPMAESTRNLRNPLIPTARSLCAPY